MPTLRSSQPTCGEKPIRILTPRQMERRDALYNIWEAGFIRASGPDEGRSVATLLLFAKFIEVYHADLVLSEEETAVTAMMTNILSDELSSDIEANLSSAATQTGIVPACLRAIAHGLAVGNMCPPTQRKHNAQSLFGEAAQLILESSGQVTR